MKVTSLLSEKGGAKGHMFKNVEFTTDPTTPNLLRGTRCYLIGHMQYKDGRGWRKTVKEQLGNLGIKFFDPYHKPFIHDVPEDEEAREDLKKWMETEQYDLVHTRMKKVVKCDRTLCRICDFYIAVIVPEVASWGSANEIDDVIDMEKPLFLVIDHPQGKKATPLWLMGKIDPKYIYNNIEEAIQTIRFIDAGIIKMTSDHWNLLQKDQR